MCVPDGSGWAIAAQMDKEGSTTLETFSEWWAAESITAEAHAFINEAFPGAKLVERHGDHLRYQLPETDDPLSTMFGKVCCALCLFAQSLLIRCRVVRTD